MIDPAPHGCQVCGDVAEPMEVLTVDAGSGLAACRDTGGVARDVELALLDGIRAGDRVLVHAGVAIAPAPEPGS